MISSCIVPVAIRGGRIPARPVHNSNNNSSIDRRTIPPRPHPIITTSPSRPPRADIIITWNPPGDTLLRLRTTSSLPTPPRHPLAIIRRRSTPPTHRMICAIIPARRIHDIPIPDIPIRDWIHGWILGTQHRIIIIGTPQILAFPILATPILEACPRIRGIPQRIHDRSGIITIRTIIMAHWHATIRTRTTIVPSITAMY
mmetsp:Transcript_17604/g.42358  ORF Transcript_17604/g.42358 Transcript_17604/m.42358 type:complete len:200 (-) Transcript_17604:152-751(-)